LNKGSHEGDWEHITVRVSPDGEKIIGVYMAAHGWEGRWFVFYVNSHVSNFVGKGM